MPRNLSTGDTQFEGVRVVASDGGTVTGLLVTINYATKDESDAEVTRIREERDVWDDLTAAQKTQVQGIYNRITSGVRAVYD